jgi:hypothetical protein
VQKPRQAPARQCRHSIAAASGAPLQSFMAFMHFMVKSAAVRREQGSRPTTLNDVLRIEKLEVLVDTVDGGKMKQASFSLEMDQDRDQFKVGSKPGRPGSALNKKGRCGII